jgi:guanylate kinase
MEKKIKILALFGKSASGKDSVQKWIVSNYPQLTNKIVSCTTRPPRSGEQDGVDYFFLSDEEFAKKVLDGSMLEATSFREWFYGTALDQLDPDKINIGVFNITGVECILEDPRLDVVPVWIYASDKARLRRSLDREDNPDCKEICRRFLADEKDFDEMDDFDYFGWVNEDIDMHESWSYRFSQLARILDECCWAILYNHN